MDVNFRLRPEAIDIVSASNKAQILEAVAARFAEVYGVDCAEVLESLEEREALGSTGFGIARNASTIRAESNPKTHVKWPYSSNEYGSKLSIESMTASLIKDS